MINKIKEFIEAFKRVGEQSLVSSMNLEKHVGY